MNPIEIKTRQECENKAIEHFRETITVNKEGRYEFQLPWVKGKESLKTNRDTAEQRLRSTTNKLIRNQKLLEYEAVFNEWFSEGVIEEVPVEEFQNPCHYLPYRGVYKENSTTKLKPVFDASCRVVKSPSLNECLEKGPNLLERIPPILLSFRKDQIGVISDIRKAFLQISVSEKDRNFLLFFMVEGLR